MDSWYKNKFEDLNNKTTKHVDTVRSVRENIVTAKKDVSINDLSLKGLNLGNIFDTLLIFTITVVKLLLYSLFPLVLLDSK